MKTISISLGYPEGGRILPLLAIAVVLAGPSRLRGQCISGQTPPPTALSVSLSATQFYAGDAMNITATIKLNQDGGFGNGLLGIYIQYGDDGGLGWTGQVFIGCLVNSGTTVFHGTAPNVTKPTTYTLTASGAGKGSATFQVLPVGPSTGGANNGPAACVIRCTQPINIAGGNVWIQHQDYSIPGLGGGLNLTRTWNSRLDFANPPALTGMFGLGRAF